MSDLEALVRDLLKPRAYHHRPPGVELIETHISLVFLAGDYVYKIKKPVDLGFLDFTTLEKRRFYCQREVELNRRLCGDIYLGVVPITREDEGFRAEGNGRVAEYAVKMRRLPQERMMDELLRRGQVSMAMMEQVARRLAAFHAQTETNSFIAKYGLPSSVRKNTEENFDQTQRYIGVTISLEQFWDIRRYTNAFLEIQTPLFHRRIAEGRIRDCHGDVHSEHVCFTDGICIYDCIEFNDRFRYGDVAAEVAFLAMDLDYAGHPELARAFVEGYVAASGDEELPQLLSFYRCYRAYVRGKVESFKLDGPHVLLEEREQVINESQHHFALAHSYVDPGLRPNLFITAGLIGTGKTTVASLLARRIGAQVISSDAVRKELAQISAQEHRYEAYESGIYSAQFSRRTYEEIFRRAAALLEEGHSVIIDASFRKIVERQQALKLAATARANLLVLECVAPDEIVKEWLRQRQQEGTAISDGRLDIFDDLKRGTEPVTEVPPNQHLVVDTSGSLEDAIRQILAVALPHWVH